jgi:hypothetical protein
MTPIITPVSAIVGGRINFKLKVRFIHMWSIPEFGNPAEAQFIHMLLLDERVHVHLLYVWLFDFFFYYLTIQSDSLYQFFAAWKNTSYSQKRLD